VRGRPVKTIVAALAERAVALREQEGARIRPAARDAFVDWLAVTLGGSTRPITTALLDGLGPGGGPSRVVGREARVAAPTAALINGAAAHVLELDDIYAPGLFHPGAPVIAAALAVADQRDATFGRLLRAVVVGYEVGCRLAADLGPSHYAHWHTTGTAGAVAAADVLEGPAGFAAATGTTTDWAASRAAADRPLAIEHVTVKPFACCGHAFAPIDGAARLRADGLAATDVEELVVDTYATAIATAGIAALHTVAERNFSIPYLVAAALVVGPERMFDERVADDALVEHLTARVRLVPDAEFDARFPARRGARVTAVLAGGQRRVVDVPDRPGSPERPLGADGLAAKFVAVAAPVLGDGATAALDALLALHADTPVRALDLGAALSGR